MKNSQVQGFIAPAWREKVYIETTEHIIIGYVFMPQVGKQSRMLSDILNTEKQFIAVKDCSLEYKNKPRRAIENHDFLQLNMSSILIMRPAE